MGSTSFRLVTESQRRSTHVEYSAMFCAIRGVDRLSRRGRPRSQARPAFVASNAILLTPFMNGVESISVKSSNSQATLGEELGSPDQDGMQVSAQLVPKP